MTVYNINHGIGWASSGVEYAQAYRGSVLRKLGIDAKFIFTDFFSADNIISFTRNIGFQDKEIIWLYNFFSDIELAPTTFSIEDLQKQYLGKLVRKEDKGRVIKFFYEDENIYLTVYLDNFNKDKVHRVEIVSNNNLIRKDYYSYTRTFSEYYYPKDGVAHLYQRRFYNEDESTAFLEMVENSSSRFIINGRLLPSKVAFFDYFLESMTFTSKDIILLDRGTDTAQSLLRHGKPAKLGTVVHAEHFSENAVTADTILWNNYYDYQFTNANRFDFFITSTDKQTELLEQQFKQFTNHNPRIITIPVGSIDNLKMPMDNRRPYSILTASRLASEKHVDWLVRAVIRIREILPEVTFDIYGSGGEEEKIRNIINAANATEYIRLMGHKNLSNVYQNYELYLTASKSEGFGLTLLEAIGAGLPLIGFDVRYGNQTFIKYGENGYLIPRFDMDDEEAIVEAFKEKVLQLFQQDQKALREASYAIAEGFLTNEVEGKWYNLVKELVQDD
ncbi:TPA: accessory Sec system glycosyltransferase GtfA [Streptococcus agalactiae]